MTDGCRVLLLRLLDDMSAAGVVSVPRSRLAADLGIAPARVSERIKLARSLGYLMVQRRARPKVTAVYRATIPAPAARGTDSVPQPEVRPPVPHRGTDSVPLNPGSEVRMYPTQEDAAERHGGLVPERADDSPGGDVPNHHSAGGRGPGARVPDDDRLDRPPPDSWPLGPPPDDDDDPPPPPDPEDNGDL